MPYVTETLLHAHFYRFWQRDTRKNSFRKCQFCENTNANLSILLVNIFVLFLCCHNIIDFMRVINKCFVVTKCDFYSILMYSHAPHRFCHRDTHKKTF